MEVYLHLFLTSAPDGAGSLRLVKLHRKRIDCYILNYKVGYMVTGKRINFLSPISEM
jgi:hypothetical protein